MTVGLCMDIVEIGLAMHLRYIRPSTRTDRQPEPLRGGGSAPINELGEKGASGGIRTSNLRFQRPGLNHSAIQANSSLVVKLGIYNENKYLHLIIAIYILAF